MSNYHYKLVVDAMQFIPNNHEQVCEFMANRCNDYNERICAVGYFTCPFDHCCAKLTKEDVLFIRENYTPRDSKYGARALGRRFNVGKNSILSIINGTSYVNV